MILFRQSFLELANPEKLQTVLAHELAHIRHGDLYMLGPATRHTPHPLGTPVVLAVESHREA